MMQRVAKKMGIGERGALVPGTGLQALEALQKLGSDPSFWSDDDDDAEDEDSFLDDLQAELSGKKPSVGGRSANGGSKWYWPIYGRKL